MGNVITGTDLAIDVGKNYKGKLNIHGKTEQATRSGKNLLNYNDFTTYGTTIITNETISVNNSTDSAISGISLILTNLLPSGTYTFTNCSSSNGGIYVMTSSSDYSHNVGAGNSYTFTYDGTSYLRLLGGNIAVNETKIYQLQLEKGTVATDYEPYGASPSPEFPSEIENVEGKNLFDKNDFNELNAQFSNNVIVNKSSERILYFKCDKNTSYAFQKSLETNYIRMNVAETTELPVLNVACQNITDIRNTKNIYTTSDTAEYIVFWYYSTGSDLTQQEILDSIQIEKGTVATEYAPYNSLAVKVTGKNLFNIENRLLGEIDSNGDLVIPYSTNKFYEYNFKENTQYTLSAVVKNANNGGNQRFRVYYTDGTYDAKVLLNNSTDYTYVTFTTQAGKTIDYISSNYSSNQASTDTPTAFYIKKGELQIEEGTETLYEPYKSQTAYFPLAEGQKLMEGSYLADDGVHNKRKQLLVDVSTIQRYSNYQNVAYALIPKPVDYIGYDNYNYYNIYCNTASSKNVAIWDSDTNINYIFTQGSKNNFMVGFPYGTTLEEMKTALEGTIIEYELAEEEIVPYTKKQQEAWDNMQEIYLFEGKNYFNNINKLKPELELEYLKIVDDDTDFYISENGRLVIPEYDINYLIDLNASNVPSMPEAVEASVRIVGKDGDVTLNTNYEPMNFSIVCYTDDNLTLQEKVAEEQKINRFIDSMKNETKVFAIEKDGKFYEVKYNGVLTTVRFPAHIQFTIPVKSSESYAQDLIRKRIQGNGSENSETIKEVGAVFTIRGPAQTPKISFNNYHMEFDEVLLENTELIIDSNKSTATHVNHTLGVKTNVMKHYNHEFPKVRFGENILAVNSGINDASQVKVEWNDLKL